MSKKAEQITMQTINTKIKFQINFLEDHLKCVRICDLMKYISNFMPPQRHSQCKLKNKLKTIMSAQPQYDKQLSTETCSITQQNKQ